jgi:hypothetical protein
MTTKLSGDKLSRAAAEAMGWTVVKNGREGCPDESMRRGKEIRWSIDMRYVYDNRLLGEMLEWLATTTSDFEVKRKDGGWVVEWRSQIGHWLLFASSSLYEAVARCVVEVGKMLKENP